MPPKLVPARAVRHVKTHRHPPLLAPVQDEAAVDLVDLVSPVARAAAKLGQQVTHHAPIRLASWNMLWSLMPTTTDNSIVKSCSSWQRR